MEAKAPGGLFIGTNGEWHDSEGRHVPKDEAEKRIAEHKERRNREGKEDEALTLARQENEIRLNAAAQAAERTGLTGAMRAIARASQNESEEDLRDRLEGDPSEELERQRERRLGPKGSAIREATEQERGHAQSIADTGAQVPNLATGGTTSDAAEETDLAHSPSRGPAIPAGAPAPTDAANAGEGGGATAGTVAGENASPPAKKRGQGSAQS